MARKHAMTRPHEEPMPIVRLPHPALTLALLALAGCCSGAVPTASSSAAQAAATAPTAASAPDARQQALQLIGDASCSSDSQCRTVAWGAKACGGPQAWVAYSTTQTDGAALEQLSQQEAARQRLEQQRRGIVSNCQYVPDPGAQCVASRCVLRHNRGAEVQ
jgi:hypothetical protein